MQNANDVRNIHEASEDEIELVHLALFPDGFSECTQCGHPARMHEAKVYPADVMVFCACRMGTHVDYRIRGRECYNDELKAVILEELSEGPPF